MPVKGSAKAMNQQQTVAGSFPSRPKPGNCLRYVRPPPKSALAEPPTEVAQALTVELADNVSPAAEEEGNQTPYHNPFQR